MGIDGTLFDWGKLVYGCFACNYPRLPFEQAIPIKITPNAKLVEKFAKAKRLLTLFSSKRRFSGSPGHHIVQFSTKL